MRYGTPTRPSDYPAEIRAAYLQLPALPARIRALAAVAVRRGEQRPSTRSERWRRIWSSISATVSTWDGTRAGTRWRTFSSSERRATASTSPPAWWSCCGPWGFPARVVNGFQRGEWNEVGQYLAVRQRDAHSWAEVFFPDAGWVTFDPSPRAAFEAQVFGVSGRLGKYFDSLRWRWNRYVVDYNVGDQAAVAIRLRQQSLALRRGLTQAWDRWSFEAYRSARRHWRSYGYIVVGAGRPDGRGRHARAPHPARRAWRRLAPRRAAAAIPGGLLRAHATRSEAARLSAAACGDRSGVPRGSPRATATLRAGCRADRPVRTGPLRRTRPHTRRGKACCGPPQTA